MKYSKVLIFIFSICLIATLFPQSPPDSSGTTLYGYSMDDKNNNGITDSFESDSLPPSDSLAREANPGQVDDIQRRMGRRNLHGQHGKELDRGESPHTH